MEDVLRNGMNDTRRMDLGGKYQDSRHILFFPS